MKVVIEQQKLKDILDYLQVSSLFPFPNITIKKGEMISIQETSDHAVFRYVKFTKEYFKTLSDKEENIKIDADKLHKIISREEPTSVLTITTKDGRLIVEGKRSFAKLNLVDTDVGAKDKLPFDIKKGVPYFKGNVPLDTYVSMGLKSFKSVVEYAKVLDTEFFKYEVTKDREFSIKVGDLEGYAETVEYNPNAQIRDFGGPVNVVLAKGVKELADTFTGNVGIRMRTAYPAWFFEASHKHRFGVLIAPHSGE